MEWGNFQPDKISEFRAQEEDSARNYIGESPEGKKFKFFRGDKISGDPIQND